MDDIPADQFCDRPCAQPCGCDECLPHLKGLTVGQLRTRIAHLEWVVPVPALVRIERELDPDWGKPVDVEDLMDFDAENNR